MGNFSDKLMQATNEDKQVNPIYVNEIKKVLPKVSNGTSRIDTETIIYPEIKTDGIYRCYYIDDTNDLEVPYLLQLECKLDVDFTDSKERANVLTQVCCYLEQIHDNVVGFNGDWNDLGNSIPKVIVLGSKVNCMALPTQTLLPHAIGHIYGYKSASTAYLKPENALKVSAIANDGNIQVQSIVYNTTDKDCISRLCEELVKIGKGLRITDDLNEHTISLAFDFFDMYVMESKSSSKLTSREKVDLFIGTFFNEEFDEVTSRGQSQPDRLRIHGIEVKVNPDKYNQFKLLYNMREYSRLEQKQITAITDRLIEDTDRRRKGDFYTPSIWVDEAHKLLDRNLGENWRDEYMVWDCAWGTGNLTRDYQFNDLYCSTLQQEDLNIATRYNRTATKFQYDFLNDDVEEMEMIKTEFARPLQFKDDINMSEMEPFLNFAKVLDLYFMVIDKGFMTQEDAQIAYSRAINILKQTKLYKSAPTLIDGLLGDKDHEPKKLLFLINPPYGTSGEMSSAATGKEKKSGIATTVINELMDNEQMGACRQQLYAQFIYRIELIKKLFGTTVITSIFCPPLMLSGKQYDRFRQQLLVNRYIDGFIFQASQFANVKSGWGISFTIWGDNNKNCFLLEVKSAENGKISTEYNKTIYYTDKRASDWVKEVCKDYKEEYKQFTMSNAITVTDGECGSASNVLAWAMMNQNIPESNLQFVMMLNSKLKGHISAFPITSSSFDRIISYYTARKIIQPNWINSKDEYMIPNTEDLRYNQWQNDSIIYSLFNNSSQQSSLRNIEYNGKTWNIQNEFFWMSVKEIVNLAGGLYSKDDINTVIEDDIEEFGKERYVYKKLQEVTLSHDAQEVLDKATEIVKKSFKYRKEFNIKHPEYHINTWDAGWYQIKGMCKEYVELKKDLDDFNKLYKALGDRMRPLVYELGFLYK